MSDNNPLANKSCAPCAGGIAAMAGEDAEKLMACLHPDWVLDRGENRLHRRLEFKGYAKAVYHANLAAWLADQEGHHPDVAFGWGYCEIVFTTHEAGGVTENDFICAAKLDRLLGDAP